jgi:DNA-binding transcriptional ArsR family regulator
MAKSLSTSQVESTCRMIKSIADTDRLKILQSLRSGSKNVGQLAKILRAEIVNVSHHLSVLRESKVVMTEKRGRFVYYRLNPDAYRAGTNGDVLILGNSRLEL